MHVALIVLISISVGSALPRRKHHPCQQSHLGPVEHYVIHSRMDFDQESLEGLGLWEQHLLTFTRLDRALTYFHDALPLHLAAGRTLPSPL